MIGTRATALPFLLAAAALFAGCKKEVTNEQSTSTDPTVEWTTGGSDGAADTGADTGAEAATAEEGAEAEGPTVVIVGGEAPVEAAAR